MRATVGFAGLKLAGGVVMGKNHSCGPISDYVRKHLARVNGALVKQAYCHHSFFDNLICAVQGDTKEVLLLFPGDVG